MSAEHEIIMGGQLGLSSLNRVRRSSMGGRGLRLRVSLRGLGLPPNIPRPSALSIKQASNNRQATIMGGAGFFG